MRPPSWPPDGRTVGHRGRGLCRGCHARRRRDGTLADAPRATMSADEVLEEWVMLRGEGHTVAQAAERLGMTYGALEKALDRARKRGDERAKRHAS